MRAETQASACFSRLRWAACFARLPQAAMLHQRLAWPCVVSRKSNVHVGPSHSLIMEKSAVQANSAIS